MKSRSDIEARIEQIRRINDNKATPVRMQVRADVVEWALNELEADVVDFDAIDAAMDDAIQCWRDGVVWSPATSKGRAVGKRVGKQLSEAIERGAMHFDSPADPEPPKPEVIAPDPDPDDEPSRISPRTGKPVRKYKRKSRKKAQ